MLDHILTLESLEIEAKKVDEFLNITCSEDINECVFRGNELVVYLARTSKMLADAKYWQDEAIMRIWKEMAIELSPSIMNKVINASCKRENYCVNWIERLNRTCVHQLDFIRTLISKAKVEMQYQQ